jgi:hypothetical protein
MEAAGCDRRNAFVGFYEVVSDVTALSFVTAVWYHYDL